MIEASFGTFQPFNHLVRSIFVEQLRSTSEPRQSIRDALSACANTPSISISEASAELRDALGLATNYL